MTAGKMWQWEVRADTCAITSSAADVRQRGNWRWRKTKSSWSPPSGTCFPQQGCTSWKIDNIFWMAPPAGNQVFEALCTWTTFLIPITLPSHLIRNIKGNYLESKQAVHMGTGVALTSKEQRGKIIFRRDWERTRKKGWFLQHVFLGKLPNHIQEKELEYLIPSTTK